MRVFANTKSVLIGRGLFLRMAISYEEPCEYGQDFKVKTNLIGKVNKYNIFVGHPRAVVKYRAFNVAARLLTFSLVEFFFAYSYWTTLAQIKQKLLFCLQ